MVEPFNISRNSTHTNTQTYRHIDTHTHTNRQIYSQSCLTAVRCVRSQDQIPPWAVVCLLRKINVTYSLGHGLHTFNAVHSSTQPSTILRTSVAQDTILILEDSIFILKIQDSILSCIFKVLLKSIVHNTPSDSK